jgi:hypothetical protein
MKNLNYKIQVLKENYSKNEGDLTFKEYVESEAEADPNFFRWFFDEPLEEDFNNSLTKEQEKEYQRFLDDLT